ncbi:hypothetical protein H5410_052138, partial [Solanum commersonii]
KKKVRQRGLGIAQLERIKLEEQHKEDSIFKTIHFPKFIPTSSRIDFSSKGCVFTPNQSAPFLENCSKLWSGENSQGVNQKVDHHGVVFGHNMNFPSVLQQRCQQYQKASTSTFHMEAPSIQSESESPFSVRETKALNGDFLSLAPPRADLPHLGIVNRCSLTNSAPQCLQLFDYVPSRVAAAEPTPPSGLSTSVQQPILGFFPYVKVQIDREGTHGSDFRAEAEGNNVDLELKL